MDGVGGGGTVEGPGSKEGVGTAIGLQNEIRFFKKLKLKNWYITAPYLLICRNEINNSFIILISRVIFNITVP